jgi:hypothetical protein
VDGQNRKCLIPGDKQEFIGSFCVSPDGRRVALDIVTGDFKAGTETSELYVVDRDGKQRRHIPTALSQFRLLDWTFSPQ